MSNETIFFIFGIALAVSAVAFSLIGLKVKGFPGKAFPVVVLWFAILVGGAFENGGKEESGSEEGSPSKPVSGPGGKLEVATVDDELKFDTTELKTKPGKVEIDFTNESGIPHNFEVEDEAGEVLGGTETIAESEANATVELEPGTYTFFCSIPGHREAGMEGKLVVK
jgi:plastocyanin